MYVNATIFAIVCIMRTDYIYTVRTRLVRIFEHTWLPVWHMLPKRQIWVLGHHL